MNSLNVFDAFYWGSIKSLGEFGTWRHCEVAKCRGGGFKVGFGGYIVDIDEQFGVNACLTNGAVVDNGKIIRNSISFSLSFMRHYNQQIPGTKKSSIGIPVIPVFLSNNDEIEYRMSSKSCSFIISQWTAFLATEPQNVD